MCNPSRGCGGCRIANGYRQGTPNGVRGRGRERPRATDMEALTGLGGMRERDRAECGNKPGTALSKSPLSKA